MLIKGETLPQQKQKQKTQVKNTINKIKTTTTKRD